MPKKTVEDKLIFDNKEELITAIIQNRDMILDEIMAAAGLQFIVPEEGISIAINNEKDILDRFFGKTGDKERATY